MRKALWLVCALGASILVFAASRPPDIRFRIQMIDPGFSETAAVADLNNDGKPDIISGEDWYEAPNWTKHHIRDINFNGNYIDNFSDFPIDVDSDGYIDVVQFGYFSGNIVWLKNPGKKGGLWQETEIDKSGPTEFAFMVDLNNDGKAQELLPEFDRQNVPLAWFELQNGKWIKHVVSSHSYGHGIGVGDINGDGRNDILTPKGWLEAPPDPRAPGEWTFHPTDWDQHPIPASGSGRGTAPTGRGNVPPVAGAPPPAGAAPPNAAGAPATPATTPQPTRGTSFGFMYLIDINGDGRKDILTTMAHDYGLCWFEQGADGQWTQHVIDNTWSQAHASVLIDINGDGQPDLLTGKRYMAHNGSDPGEREPIGLYWYEYRKNQNGAIEWIRHIIDYGGRMGGGMQIVVKDMDGDGDLDVVSGGKAGLFLAENLTKSAPMRAGK